MCYIKNVNKEKKQHIENTKKRRKNKNNASPQMYADIANMEMIR